MKLLNKNNTTYYIILLFFIVSFFLILFTEGKAIRYYLFPNATDSYMDLYNSINNSRELKEIGIYPPLAHISYNIISYIAPLNLRDSPLSGRQNALNLRESLIGSYIFLMYYLLSLVPLILIISMDKERSVKEISLVLLSVIFSGPMLFTLQRGNNIIFALLFTMLFFYFKDSKSYKQRELSIIFLALAANLKIYPAIFCLFLLQKKEFKYLFRFAVYGTLFLVVPMFFYEGGVSNILKLLGNLVSFSITNHGRMSGVNLNCSISNSSLLLYRFIFKGSGIPISLFIFLGKILTVLTLIIGIWTFFHTKNLWKKKASLGILCILIPGVSYLYTVIFLIPAFLDFNRKNFEIIPAILFGIIFSFNTIPVYIASRITLSFFAIQVSLILLAVYLFVDGINTKIQQSRSLRTGGPDLMCYTKIN